MKTAYNFDYAQTETFTLTFTQQAIIVYDFVPTFKKLLCRSISMLMAQNHSNGDKHCTHISHNCQCAVILTEGLHLNILIKVYIIKTETT